MTSTIKTEHTYIVRNKEICAGRPIIKGTRISVQSIAWYYKEGITPEQIKEELPHLTLSQIYDAISYYHDHQEAIEADIKTSRMENIISARKLQVSEKGFIKNNG